MPGADRDLGVGRVVAVNVVAEFLPIGSRFGGASGIDKRPVDGRVDVGRMGLDGDRQVNRRHHGGPDKAVYAYAVEDASWWADRLGRDVPPGLFGENLTTEGVEVSEAVIGEQWAIGDGDLVVEVTMPRTPCATFQRRMGEPRWVARFTEAGRTGAYLRVVVPGSVGAGDRIRVADRPEHGVTVGGLFGRRVTPDDVRRLLTWGEATADEHAVGGTRLSEPVLEGLASYDV